MTTASQNLIKHFGVLYREKIGEEYPRSWGRDGKIFSEMLKCYSEERIAEFLNRYFGVERKLYSIPFFKTALSDLIQQEAKENPPLPDLIPDNENWRFE